jgi:pyruvate,water dikinase
MLNLGNPELAFRTAMLPNDGVGLARMEFIISEHIGVHPMALVNPEQVTSTQARKAIQRLVRNYARPADYFVEKLSEGIGLIAAAFYPKPVIVRLSDFKTNEYAKLIGAMASSLGKRTRCWDSAVPRAMPTPPMPLGLRSNAPRCAGFAKTWD